MRERERESERERERERENLTVAGGVLINVEVINSNFIFPTLRGYDTISWGLGITVPIFKDVSLDNFGFVGRGGGESEREREREKEREGDSRCTFKGQSSHLFPSQFGGQFEEILQHLIFDLKGDTPVRMARA